MASLLINWENDYWTHYQDHDISLTANIAMVNSSDFEAECPTEGAYAFVVAISDIVDYSSTSCTP